jgi:hypothetical protein
MSPTSRESNVRLPALWIAEEGSFGVTDEPLTRCSYFAYRRGFWQGLRFLDADGRSWIVQEAVVTRRPRLLDRLLNRSIGVSLRLSGPLQLPLPDVIELLCSCLERDPDEVYDQFSSRDELKALFRSARTVPELLHHARTLA